MPCDMTPYGDNWPLFSATIRFVRAKSQCECCGTCGMHRGRRCCEKHHTRARWARGLVRLTVAHLCTCSPPCQDPNHVLAMCQRCHLRTDAPRKARTRQEARHAIAQEKAVQSLNQKTVHSYSPLSPQDPAF